MAGFNEILHGRITRFFQKWAGIKGRPPVTSLGSEVQPQLSIMSGVEDRFLQSWAKFGTSRDNAAVAGQNLAWQLRNPTGSGVIAVVEQIVVSSTGSISFHVGISHASTITDLTTTQNTVQIDGRNPTANSTCVPSFAITTQPELQQINSGVISGVTMDLMHIDDDEIPLPPGDTVRVNTESVNLPFNVSFRWRERILEDAEKIG